MSLKEAAEVKPLGDGDFVNLAGAFIKFDVHHIADLLAVSDVDDFFFLESGV